MCSPNRTVMLQVRAHAIADLTKNQNSKTIGKWLQIYGTKVQGYLNDLGQFKKLVDDISAIDSTYVPTNLALMGILNNVMKTEDVLWGNLEFNSDGMSLNKMMDHFQVETERLEKV